MKRSKNPKLPNGLGSIGLIDNKENRRKKYRVRKTIGWKDDGTQIKKTIGYAKTWHEGYKMLIEYNNAPFDLDLRQLTFNEWFDKWIVSLEKRDVKTIPKYKYALKHCDIIKNLPINEIRTIHLQTVIDNMDDLSYESKKVVKNIMSQTFIYAIKNDAPVSQNYVKHIELGKATKSTLHKPFSAEEKGLLWNNKDYGFAELIIVDIYTGLRPSEMLDLETENVFIDKKYMIGGSKTEAGTDRIIPMHDKIIPIIEKWYNPNNKYLFTFNNKKIDYDTYLEKFHNVCDYLKIKHLPHDCRHTCATDLDNVEANEICKKLILGHSIRDITGKVYTHKRIEQLIETINLLN